MSKPAGTVAAAPVVLALALALWGGAAAQGADTPDECSCVPYYQCDSEGTIIHNGVGLIDIRVQGECEHYLDVCCKEPAGARPPPVEVRQPGVCGRRNPEGVGFRITGGRDGEAQFAEFPWMAAVLVEETEEGVTRASYQCGGALIHPQIVLTAAHCVHEARSDRLLVRLGEWDTQTDKEPLPFEDRRVGKVTLHPDFRADALYNDMALLFLDAPAAIADNVDVVCLPPPGVLVDHQNCFASGWGKDVFGKDGRYQVILKKVEQPMVPRAECVERLRQTRLGPHFTLHESFVCAGGIPGRDTCQGDGGSPLVCPLANDPTRYQQVGIVAWGIGCGGESPAVYANVAMFREWIDQQVFYANLNITYIA